MPKVSVLMGVYNGAAILKTAISSIQKQSFQDWEFIICDDCSTDTSYEILCELAKQDSRIHILRNAQNRKLAATLNRCLKVAKGEYIARMDDDDFSYPERFQKQVDFLETHPEYAFVSSLVDCFDGKQIVRNHFLRPEKPQAKDFLSSTQFVHPATMFRRSALLSVQAYRVCRWTERTEDYDLFMRLYAAGMRGYNIQQPLLRYTVNVSGMQKKRLYRYRINEAVVRYQGFRAMGLLPKAWPWVLRPLLVGLIPQTWIWKLGYAKNKK
ncbi:MAG: glycosyltransferase [bacterium]|nr:glycosyltransferase [bacterium]